MTNWIAAVMVVIAYALGHAGGYRLCKLRVKNMLIERIRSAYESGQPPAWKELYGKALHQIVREL